MTDIKQIAEGLSGMDRAVLEYVHKYRITHRRRFPAKIRRLEELGLLYGKGVEVVGVSPHGQQVRTYLLEKGS